MMPKKSQLRWMSADDKYHVVISRYAFRMMVRTAKNHLPNETGSSLVGKYSHDGFTAFVLDVAPQPTDSKSSPVSFVRGKNGMKEFFQKLTKRFQRKRFYVGEWHSHPLAESVSSGTDRTTHAEIASDSTLQCPEVIMIIVGGDFSNKVTLSVNVFSRDRGRVVLVPK